MCCYSSFDNYLPHIQNIYADEITIEAVCSGLQLLDAFKLESNTSGDDDCDCGWKIAVLTQRIPGNSSPYFIYNNS